MVMCQSHLSFSAVVVMYTCHLTVTLTLHFIPRSYRMEVMMYNNVLTMYRYVAYLQRNVTTQGQVRTYVVSCVCCVC